MDFRKQTSLALAVPMLAFAVVLFFGLALDKGTNAYTQVTILSVLVNIILALSLNLVNGFTGQFSIGHAGFMAVGAYVSGYLSMRPEAFGTRIEFFPMAFDFLNYPIYAVLGGGMAALAGWLVGLPSLRLKGDYLAIVTLGFGEIIRVILLNMPSVGGARGMYGIPSPTEATLLGFVFTPFYLLFFWAAFWTLLAFIFHWRMVNSTHGRAFLSVREDEIAAEAMGIDTTKTKVHAFVFSSFFAGIAGSLYAHTFHYLNPSTFSFNKSVDFIIMVVLGGMGSLSGSVISAIIVTILPEWVLRPLQEYTGKDYRMVIFSLLLIIFMVLRPSGLFGTNEITTLWRKYVRKSA